MSTQHLSAWLEIMAEVFSNLRVNLFSAVRGRPTLKVVERFRNELNLMRNNELYESSMYE